MGKSNLPLLGRSSPCFNAIERDSMSTHIHGLSFLSARTVSFDQTKANNRCPYNLAVLQHTVSRSCRTTFLEMAGYTLSSAAAYLCHKEAGEGTTLAPREQRGKILVSTFFSSKDVPGFSRKHLSLGKIRQNKKKCLQFENSPQSPSPFNFLIFVH